jgi:hypothetical protein
MLGAVYHQGRNDVWAMSPRELHSYLQDWGKRQQESGAGQH